MVSHRTALGLPANHRRARLAAPHAARHRARTVLHLGDEPRLHESRLRGNGVAANGLVLGGLSNLDALQDFGGSLDLKMKG
jgi:hypothetical protein